MPEQAYTPTETKYEVHIDELMKAIKGEPFEQGNGLWRMKGEDIIRRRILFDLFSNIFIYKEREYVIISEAKLIKAGMIFLRNDTHTDYNVGLVFYKSIIPFITFSHAKIGDLHCWNSQLDDIRISDHSRLGNIRISDHSQTGSIIINENSQTGNISIERNSESGYVNVGNNSQTGSIIINANSQSGHISIEGNSKSGDISIEGNSESGYVNVGNNSQTGSIIINENSQMGDIHISGKSESGNIDVRRNSQNGDIIIKENSQSGNISLSTNKTARAIKIFGQSQTGSLSFSDALISHINIEQNCFALSLYNTQFLIMQITRSLLTKVEWQAGTKGELYISQSQLLHLEVANTSLLKDSLLSLSDTLLQYGVLEEVLVQGNLFLRKVGSPQAPFAWRDIDAQIEEAPTDEWQKELWDNKKILLEKQKQELDKKVVELAKQYGPDPVFRITQSSLGKTEITGCDFSNFQFQYYNSNLLGCFIAGTQLPKRNMVIYDPVTDTVLNNQSQSHALFEQKTAVYNQFKKIYENQGDVVEASVFHAQAMHWQQKLLWRQFRHDKEGFWKKVKLFFENIGFRLNWFSNNHGESWLVALVFTIGVGIVFFTASIWGLTHWGDFKTLNDHIHKLPGFMLPTHSYDYLSKDIVGTTQSTYPNLKVNLWHTSWDFLGRIFIGYGIFQFISAFRRHGKKGG